MNILKYKGKIKAVWLLFVVVFAAAVAVATAAVVMDVK